MSSQNLKNYYIDRKTKWCAQIMNPWGVVVGPTVIREWKCFYCFRYKQGHVSSLFPQIEKGTWKVQHQVSAPTINMRTCKWLLELKWFELNISKIWWQDKLWSWGIQMQVLLNIKTYGILLKHDLKIKTIGQKFSSKLKILKRIMQRQDAIYIA